MKRSAIISFFLATAVFAYSQTVENVILMIPDGCSGNLIELYKMVSTQDPIKFPPLVFEDIQTGMICTLNCDGQTTDSAAAGTAYATGVKTKNAYVAMSIDGKMLPTIAEKAKQKGLGVGLLTSDSINGATPSAFCAHVCNRANVKDIAKMREAQGFDVVEGSEKKNRLGEKTTEALQVLSKNTSGFFLMVEGGEIDHAQHTNNPAGALTDLAKKKLRIANTRPTVRSLSEAITQEYKVAVPADEIEKILKANEKEYAKRSKKDQVQQLFGKVTRLINTYIFGVSYTTGGHRDIDVSLWSVGPKAMSGKVDNTDVN